MSRTCPAIVSALALFAVTTAAAPAAAQQVWTVDPAGPLTQIHQAVALASDGDVILVRPGTYQAFEIAGKSLTLHGDPAALVHNWVLFGQGYLGPALRIRDLAVDQSVTIRGLTIRLTYSEPVASALVTNCAGSVVFEDCAIDASSGPAALVSGCGSATFVRSTLLSGGPFLPSGSSQYQLNAGLRISGSNVFVYESAIVGSTGKSWSVVSQTTSDGGPGLHISSGYVLAQGCNIAGGAGGGPPTIGGSACMALGDGGPGLVVDEDTGPTRVVLKDSLPVGGAGAQPLPACTEPPGQAGPDRLVAAGDVRDVPSEQRAFGIAPLVREGQPIVATAVGVAGDLALVLVSVGPSYGFELAALDVVPHVDVGSYVVLASGAVPAGNVLGTSRTAPELGPGIDALDLTAQAVFVNSQGALFLSGPSRLTIVDGAF